MRSDYGPDLFRHGVRGKYYRQLLQETNLVMIEREIMEAFPTPESINDALRPLARARRKQMANRQPRTVRTHSRTRASD
jgi:hypothetical protein